MTKADTTVLMTRASGLLLFTLALIEIPEALGAIISLIIWHAWQSPALPSPAPDSLPNETEHLYETMASSLNTVNATEIGDAVTSLCTVIILLLLARWLFKGPAILKRWMKEEEPKS